MFKSMTKTVISSIAFFALGSSISLADPIAERQANMKIVGQSIGAHAADDDVEHLAPVLTTHTSVVVGQHVLGRARRFARGLDRSACCKRGKSHQKKADRGHKAERGRIAARQSTCAEDQDRQRKGDQQQA